MDFNTKLQEVEYTLSHIITILSLITSINECDVTPDAINGVKKLAAQMKQELLKCCDNLEDFKK